MSATPGPLAAGLPPGRAGEPYIISTQDGEIIYIPLSKSATRLLVTGKESDDAFAIVSSGGSQSDPVGFHYHRETHDVFLCLQGNVNIWAGDQCRTLSGGDFASVPPGTIHQYQMLGHHAEMVGLIVPGGWEEFFRFIGEPYDGATWPTEDPRNFFEVLLPKLKAAAEKFDMIPCPQHKACKPSEWLAADSRLPGSLQPYFLRNGTGPAYAIGGTVLRPLITTSESDGKFSIASIEGSSNANLQTSIFSTNGRKLKFSSVHHAFQVVEGAVTFSIGSREPSRVSVGELVYVPKDTEFTLEFATRYAKVYIFTNGTGLVGLLQGLGQDWQQPTLPSEALPWNEAELEPVESDVGSQLSEHHSRNAIAA